MFERLHPFQQIGKVCLVVALIVVTGCTGAPLQPYPHRQIENITTRAQQDGLIVAAKALVDRESLRKYFGEDLLALGILPIEVSIQNNNKTSSFLIESDAWSLDGKGDYASQDQLPSAQGRGFAVGGGLIGYAVAVAAINTRTQMSISEIRTYTISPGRSFTGFLYFKQPSKEAKQSQQGHTLQVRVRRLFPEQTFELAIPVDGIQG